MSLLEVRDLQIAFANKPVVHGVSFTVERGQKLALVGESGSGKTVTALSLLGLAEGAQLSGSVLLTDHAGVQHDLARLTPRQIRRFCGREIGMIFQEPMTALNPVFTIGAQISEVLRQSGQSRPEAEAMVLELLAQTGIDQPRRRAAAYPHQLSGGQRQRAMIAMALAGRPRLLLADEPTTALDPTIRLQILALLDRLRVDLDMAILLITHDLPLVRRFADRVAVMADGRVVEEAAASTLFSNPQHPITQALLASQVARDVAPAVPSAPEVLRCQGLGVQYRRQGGHGAAGLGAEPGVESEAAPVNWKVGAYARQLKAWMFGHKNAGWPALQQVDLALQHGQTLGVVGESGSGKSTLALALLGLVRFNGEVSVNGKAWGQGRAQDLQNRQWMQVVFQDPFAALSPRLTIEEIVTEGLRVHAPGLDAAARRAQALASLAEVGLDDARFPGLLQRYPHQFSGGQRQRIAIARALVVQPSVLVLDEPTSALDANRARQILELLQRLQRERGLAYVLISHDMAVVKAMAHQVLVLKAGQIVEAGSVDAVLQTPTNDYTRALLASV